MYSAKDRNGKTKITGRSKARVIDNRDPLKRGRIRVFHPLLGETVWIDYLKAPGQFDVPSIGDLVYVECDTGEQDFPKASGVIIKGTDANPKLPEQFRREIPTNRGQYTPNGHFVELDDGEATISQNPDDTQFTTKGRGIRVTSTAGNKIHIIEDSAANQEYILLETANGNFIKLDYNENKLSVNSIGTTEATTAEDKTEQVGGNFTLEVGGDINVQASGGAKAKYSNGQVAFGTDSVELLQQLSDTLQTLIDLTASMQTETHLGNLGYSSSPPENAADYGTAEGELSTLKDLVDSIKGSF